MGRSVESSIAVSSAVSTMYERFLRGNPRAREFDAVNDDDADAVNDAK